MNFCLEDGTQLQGLDSAATLVISERREQLLREEPDDADRRIQSCLEALYKFAEFEALEHDARFERLITRHRQIGFEALFKFLRRLLGRAEIAKKKQSENYDSTVLWTAISADTDDKTDAQLREHGLI